MRKKAALHNLGCKVNAYETEAMRQLLEEAGYEIVPFEPGADVYVINTCTVTNIADRKSRQMLHRARKMNPDAVVVATGCYVETADGAAEKDPAIDIVLGNNRKGELLTVLREYEEHCREKKSIQRHSLTRLTSIIQKNMRISRLAARKHAHGRISRYRMAAISSAHTVLFRLPVDGCGAGQWTMC